MWRLSHKDHQFQGDLGQGHIYTQKRQKKTKKKAKEKNLGGMGGLYQWVHVSVYHIMS